MKVKLKMLLPVVLTGVLMLSGCGAKSAKDVTEDLANKVNNMQSYQTDATMTFDHNGKKQVYLVKIDFKKPSYYRVALTDSHKQNQQMILRNVSGVYVLTPQLNKSYRFESNWPNNRSQAYLFNTLVKDITTDSNLSFKAKDNQYIFKTKTNYNTTQLDNQTITFNKNLTPQKVEVRDKSQKIIITVRFTHFKFNPNLDNKTFDVKQNMTAAEIKSSAAAAADSSTFKVAYPTATINGAKLAIMKPEVSAAGEKYILKYTGKNPFTLIETKSEKADSAQPTLAAGDPANLGFAVGTVSDNTLSWSYGGTDFMLASNALNQEELITVAQSVNGTIVK
ncbi:MAG: outer membrane lipoprotein carrier protein LolA [Sporolactobacillus sp.]